MKILIRYSVLLLLLLPVYTADAQHNKLPIIDVHLHAYTDRTYRSVPNEYGTLSPKNLENHKKATLDMMDKYNIVRAVVSQIGGFDNQEFEGDPRFIPGYYANNAPDDTTAFIKLIEEGKLKVFGEIGAIYAGKTLSDPEFDPYLKICERYNIPVMVHTGGGEPGVTYRCCPNFRISLGDPFLIEDVLAKYPKLKVCMMHAGEIFHEKAVRLMMLYPQLYAELGAVLWVADPIKDYAEEFLRRAQQFKCIDRIMFGSDQMYWAEGIEKSIQTLNSYDFLSEEEKRKIFYHNAVKFLALEEELKQ
ncbi:amidohydrolase [Fulvivirga sp. RKSG066]|uniref:amidohydrolase family protein n=1 Tax=Fulvivirga aurantia TaxID=2529383 RepID=UPI0012BB9B49|nr:amidohydrolase family protein [Fulvivirga aurantia]MTI20402.1 amidohydrolase [Fulvivirga aurantia]